MSYRTGKQEVDTQTDTHAQAMTIPVGQKASGKNYDMLKITTQSKIRQDQARQGKTKQHPDKNVSPDFEKYCT